MDPAEADVRSKTSLHGMGWFLQRRAHPNPDHQFAMAAEVVAVLESVLRKRMREEQWAADKKERVLAEKKKAIKSRRLIFARAKQYAQEYNSQNHYKYTLKYIYWPCLQCGSSRDIFLSLEVCNNYKG